MPNPIRTRISAAAFAALLAATALPLAAPALAGDNPTAEERPRIEAALRQLGFVSWDDIEKEDNGRVWEVDDAKLADGTKFDVKLSADDLREISRKRDD